MLKLLRAPATLYRLAGDGIALLRGGLADLIGRENLPPQTGRVLKLLGVDKDARADSQKLSETLARLGPSHIKLGQFLATRPDVIGAEAALALSALQDRLPPFADAAARREIENAFGRPVEELFEEFGPAVAAASIAQVHRAIVALDPEDAAAPATDDIGSAIVARDVERPPPASRDVAVKILRPGVEARFRRDLEGFYLAARIMQSASAEGRRLRPVDVVGTLERSVELEMDLRMEASALSEMAENTADDTDFRVPAVNWDLTSRRVLTTEWIDGIPLNDLDALEDVGHDRLALGRSVIQSFLRHAMRDGFFHADMHPGNLFVDTEGRLVAVDFGITGRLSPKDRRFLAEILWGFLTRNYLRIAEVHFDAGYVPERHTAAEFAQALRAIGEPIMGLDSKDVSMARLLTQLFEVTGQFDMETQPQLILLQKTMVVVEGVGRMLDPDLNMWKTAEPVVRDFMQSRLSPEGRIQDAAEGAVALGRLVSNLPGFLEEAEKATASLARLGERLDTGDARDARRDPLTVPLWIGAVALALIALSVLF